MPLEDHVGDVIAKARKSAGLGRREFASVAGVSESELEELEDEGRCPAHLSFEAVASRLGLHEVKLKGVAGGWEPSPIDTGTWKCLEVITTHGSGMDVNAFLVWDEGTKEAALFDTGFEFKPIFEIILREQLQLQHLFVTHTHHDHIAALGSIREKIPTILMHSDSKNAPQKQRLRPDDEFQIGKLRVSNRETPGHAVDGVTYVIEGWPGDAPPVAVVGDAIFAGSMGGAGDQADLAKKKVREHILSLPDETLICPGHGPLTTVGQEKDNNPFFS